MEKRVTNRDAQVCSRRIIDDPVRRRHVTFPSLLDLLQVAALYSKPRDLQALSVQPFRLLTIFVSSSARAEPSGLVYLGPFRKSIVTDQYHVTVVNSSHLIEEPFLLDS